MKTWHFSLLLQPKKIIKPLLLPAFFLLGQAGFCQAGVAVAPEHQTSYNNQDLLLISLAALALLMAMYFLFRRRRHRR